MPLVIIQANFESEEDREALGKAIVDVLAERGYDHKKTCVIFQEDKTNFFTVDTGYVAPVALPSTRFQRVSGQRTPTEEFDKAKITEDIRGLMHGFKDLSMNDIAYRLKIADKPWAGRIIREILTNLEQEGFLFKEGEKRGMRYILREDKVEEPEV